MPKTAMKNGKRNKMEEPTRGICYILWGTKNLNEAKSSVGYSYFVRAEHNLKTCIITDSQDPELKTHFDIVKNIDFDKYAEFNLKIQDTIPGILKKWIVLTESPFDTTCYVDSDTYVMDDLTLGFELAEQYKVCLIISPGMVFHYQDKEYVHYNGGVCFFSGKQPELQRKIIEIAPEIFNSGHEGDEAVLGIALRRLNMNPAVLPEVFNFSRKGQIHPRPIKIYHSNWFPANHLMSDQFGNSFPYNVRD